MIFLLLKTSFSGLVVQRKRERAKSTRRSSIDASVFDAASSVIPADGDVVSPWKISSHPAETVSVFETLCLCTTNPKKLLFLARI